MVGGEGDKIKKTLNGTGELMLKDGAVKGIDVADMVRNVEAAFGMAEKGGEKPRTDFSELKAPFTITNGLVNTSGTELMSPLLRVVATGDANLVSEALDMRVEPKVVGTLKGQGDTMQRGGVMVPILVTGTFSEPKFRPDMEGMIKKGLKEGVPAPTELKKLLPGAGAEKKEGESKPVEDTVKGLLKGIGK
jgi:AsmA protein